MNSGVMTLSVVPPRSRSIPAPSERNGLKDLTACEDVVSTTMFGGGALRCARAAAGFNRTATHSVKRAPVMAGRVIDIRRMSSALAPRQRNRLAGGAMNEQYSETRW